MLHRLLASHQAILFVLILTCGWIPITASEPMTWPHPRGPEWNGVSRERGLPLNWADEDDSVVQQQNEIWEISTIKLKHSPLVFNEKLYFLFHEAKETETEDQISLGPLSLICWALSNQDAEQIFRFPVPELDPESPTEVQEYFIVGGPKWRQVALASGDGIIRTYDADLGYPLWMGSDQELLPADARIKQVTPPLLFEHLLITSVLAQQPGKLPVANLVARDRRNGMIIWHKQIQTTEQTTQWAAPVPTAFHNRVVLVYGADSGAIQLCEIRTGKKILELTGVPSGNIPQQFCAHGQYLLALSKNLSNQNWSATRWHLPYEVESNVRDIQPTHTWSVGAAKAATALLHHTAAFVAGPNQELKILSLNTEFQDQQFSLPDSSTCWLQWVDNQLLLTNAEGIWKVWKQQDASFELVFDSARTEGLVGPPAIARRRMYVGEQSNLTALGSMETNNELSDLMFPLTDLAKESESDQPGTLLLSPAVIQITSGWKQNFQLQQFNDRGVFKSIISPEEATWNWEGPGTFDPQTGQLQIPQKSSEDLPGTFQLKAVYDGKETAAQIKIELK